jgi:demethylmenaquinone methyltransferase/2-methoxy-6-polyprenyl-1,4-benzoquinol methylase
LPFADAAFNCVTIGFGLRNVTHKERVGGDVSCAAPRWASAGAGIFKPQNPIVAAAYGAFQSLWPAIGQAVTGDANAYRYLVESIEMHPTQKALKIMIADAGFANVAYANILNGIVAIHHADKAP